jgi:hypothetical protein
MIPVEATENYSGATTYNAEWSRVWEANPGLTGVAAKNLKV